MDYLFALFPWQCFVLKSTYLLVHAAITIFLNKNVTGEKIVCGKFDAALCFDQETLQIRSRI